MHSSGDDDAVAALLPLLRAAQSHCVCPICTYLYHDPAALPCGHVFCRGCLALCLQARQQCPLCNRPVPSPRRSVVPLPHLELFTSVVRRVMQTVVDGASGGVGVGGGDGGVWIHSDDGELGATPLQGHPSAATTTTAAVVGCLPAARAHPLPLSPAAVVASGAEATQRLLLSELAVSWSSSSSSSALLNPRAAADTLTRPGSISSSLAMNIGVGGCGGGGVGGGVMSTQRISHTPPPPPPPPPQPLPLPLRLKDGGGGVTPVLSHRQHPLAAVQPLTTADCRGTVTAGRSLGGLTPIACFFDAPQFPPANNSSSSSGSGAIAASSGNQDLHHNSSNGATAVVAAADDDDDDHHRHLFAGGCLLCGLDVTDRGSVRDYLMSLLRVPAAARCEAAELSGLTEEALGAMLGPVWSIRVTARITSSTTTSSSAASNTNTGTTVDIGTSGNGGGVGEEVAATDAAAAADADVAVVVTAHAHHNCLAWAGLLPSGRCKSVFTPSLYEEEAEEEGRKRKVVESTGNDNNTSRATATTATTTTTTATTAAAAALLAMRRRYACPSMESFTVDLSQQPSSGGDGSVGVAPALLGLVRAMTGTSAAAGDDDTDDSIEVDWRMGASKKSDRKRQQCGGPAKRAGDRVPHALPASADCCAVCRRTDSFCCPVTVAGATTGSGGGQDGERGINVATEVDMDVPPWLGLCRCHAHSSTIGIAMGGGGGDVDDTTAGEPDRKKCRKEEGKKTASGGGAPSPACSRQSRAFHLPCAVLAGADACIALGLEVEDEPGAEVAVWCGACHRKAAKERKKI